MTALKKAGGRTIAEHESTAIVYGMPAELVRLGGAQLVLPAPKIADQLISWLM
jgi:two-component system chemotaxis response regulator CheB